ncbi:MAG: cupin domain-containing protein [Lentisphaerae bacterium]|nr:cupin domain-containing protein [Lentisphaerota bacterium]
MSKSTATYWNPLVPEHDGEWTAIENTNGLVEQLTLAIDEVSGDYTRLTRFRAGADTTASGASVHDYPEEVFMVVGRLYDASFDRWLETGAYASRPPGEVHGPFRAEEECLVLEVSFPSQARP